MSAPQGFYVYELVDPRDEKVFYVGKGKGNRVSQHVRDVRAGRCVNVQKTERIQGILADGLCVVERIVEVFDEEHEALAFERKRIQETAGLANVIYGFGELKTGPYWEMVRKEKVLCSARAEWEQARDVVSTVFELLEAAVSRAKLTKRKYHVEWAQSMLRTARVVRAKAEEKRAAWQLAWDAIYKRELREVPCMDDFAEAA